MAISSSATGLRPGVCTSTTRPTNPYTGQIIYETDTGYLRVWDGAAWDYLSQKQDNTVGLGPVGGLVYITQVAFTSSAQTDVSNCFSSTYDNYRIELEWLQNTSTGNMQIWLRDSGGAIATNYGFTSGGYYASSGTLTWAGFNVSTNETQTSGYVVGVVNGYRGFACYDVFGPNLSRETNLIGQVGTSNASATLTRVYLHSNIRHNAATECTGITIYPSAGTFTGTIRIYGYRQA